MATRPEIPGLEEKVDFIYSQLVDPCDAPISVWIEKMWVPLGKLVLEWYAFDVQNMIIAFVRPGRAIFGRRGRRHWGGRGHKSKRGRFWRAIYGVLEFDISEFVGKHFPGAKVVRARNVSPGVVQLWLIEGVIERFLFYWMVIDLTTDFVYRWQSAVAQTAWCHARDDAVFVGEVSDYPLIGIVGWQAINWGTPKKIRHILFYNGFGVTPGLGGGVGALSTVFTPVPGHNNAFAKARIRCVSGPNVGRESVWEETFTDDAPKGVTLGINATGGDTLVVEVIVGGVFLMGATFVVHCAKQDLPLP